jgi:hypothetical protein
VNYLVNDCSDLIYGFESMASDPVPEEISHMSLDTEIPANQVDNRILYYVPRSTALSRDLTALDERFTNDLHGSGEAQAALQILSETFSGYIVPLKISRVAIDNLGSTILSLQGFQLYRYDELEKDYKIRANIIFKAENRTTWNMKYVGVLRLVNTSNALDTFGVTLVNLDKFAGIVLNNASSEAAISTVKSFEKYMAGLFSISDKQYQNGHITGMNNQSVSNNTLTYFNRNSILGDYNFREF